MLKRIHLSAALTGLALTATLCACASATQHNASAGTGASAPSSTATSASPSSPATPASPSRSSSPASSSSSPSAPAAGAPIIFAVRLSHGFQPSTLRISPGQHFVVTVASSVKASGLGVGGSCSGTTARIYNGMLTVRCTAGTFYYTAQRRGTADLMVTVRPNCTRGSMCPQWVAVETLKVTIL
jgi:hypothetical protein